VHRKRETDRVRDYLHLVAVPVDVVQRTTQLGKLSHSARFWSTRPSWTTVDVCDPRALAAYRRARADSLPPRACSASRRRSTTKPLWAELGRTSAFGRSVMRRARHVTAGVYFLQP
jgi:hypothetical protein